MKGVIPCWSMCVLECIPCTQENFYKLCWIQRPMNQTQSSLQRISWGILLLVIAAALILIGVLRIPFLLIVPLILLGMGVWILTTGSSYYQRAWGIVITLAGGLWLLHVFTSLSLYILAGVFFAVTGILVILGSRK